MFIDKLLELEIEEYQEEIKRMSYKEILELCKSLGIETLINKNELGVIHLSYSSCIKSLEIYKDKVDELTQEEEAVSIEIPDSVEIKKENIKIVKLVEFDNNYRYYISGNKDEIGNWNVEKGMELLENREGLLECKLEIENNPDLEYKIFKVDNQENIIWESGENRRELKENTYLIWR